MPDASIGRLGTTELPQPESNVGVQGGAHGSHSAPRFLRHQLEGPRHPLTATAVRTNTQVTIAEPLHRIHLRTGNMH